jgi:hypothetical protein
MNAVHPVPRPRRRFRWRYLFLAVVVLGLTFIIALILSFRMGGEARLLRRAVFAAAPGEWERQIEIGVGRLPVLLGQTALGFLDLDPRVRAGLEAFRCADVGVYKRRPEMLQADEGVILTRVYKAMHRRGWAPLVTIREDDEAVAVFLPENPGAPSRLRICVLVLNAEDMVLVSGQANLEPLIQLAISEIPPEIWSPATNSIPRNDQRDAPAPEALPPS